MASVLLPHCPTASKLQVSSFSLVLSPPHTSHHSLNTPGRLAAWRMDGWMDVAVTVFVDLRSERWTKYLKNKGTKKQQQHTDVGRTSQWKRRLSQHPLYIMPWCSPLKQGIMLLLQNKYVGGWDHFSSESTPSNNNYNNNYMFIYTIYRLEKTPCGGFSQNYEKPPTMY